MESIILLCNYARTNLDRSDLSSTTEVVAVVVSSVVFSSFVNDNDSDNGNIVGNIIWPALLLFMFDRVVIGVGTGSFMVPRNVWTYGMTKAEAAAAVVVVVVVHEGVVISVDSSTPSNDDDEADIGVICALST